MFTTYNKLAELFNTEYTGGPFALCRQCYYKAYTTICVSHTQQQCSSCGAKAKRGTNFTRHSPDAEKVSEHLLNASSQTIIVTPRDYHH